MVKTDIKQYIDLLDGVSDLLKKQLKLEDDVRRKFLTQCQEIIIMLGERLEAVTNQKDKGYISQNALIKKLEDLCELIYTFSNSGEPGVLDEILNSIIETRQLVVSMPVTFRVVFLPYKASMWDSLESIWREFSRDEDFETSVVPIPFYEEDRTTMKYVPRYEGNLFPDDVPVVSFQEYRLEEKKPDLVFIHNPYDDINFVTMVHPDYFSKELKKNCGLLVYVSYYVNQGIMEDEKKVSPGFFNADYLVFQSNQQKECFRDTSYYERILPFGSPKFDKIIGYGIPHGYAAALVNSKLFPWMVKNTDKCIDARGEEYLKSMFADIANTFEVESAEQAAECFAEIVRSLDLGKIKGVKQEDFEILGSSVNPVRLKNNPVQLDSSTIDSLYHEILEK